MKFEVQIAGGGLVIVPAAETDRLNLEELRADASRNAEAAAHAAREEFFRGKGKRLLDIRADLDTMEESATALAGRIVRYRDEMATLIGKGDRAGAAAIETKITAGKLELDDLRHQARGLRAGLFKCEQEVRNELKPFMAQRRAEFMESRKAKLQAALDALTAAIADVGPETALEALSAIEGDGRLDKKVLTRQHKSGIRREIELWRLLNLPDELPPEIIHTRPITPADIDGDRGSLGPIRLTKDGQFVPAGIK